MDVDSNWALGHRQLATHSNWAPRWQWTRLVAWNLLSFWKEASWALTTGQRMSCATCERKLTAPYCFYKDKTFRATSLVHCHLGAQCKYYYSQKCKYYVSQKKNGFNNDFHRQRVSGLGQITCWIVMTKKKWEDIWGKKLHGNREIVVEWTVRFAGA